MIEIPCRLGPIEQSRPVDDVNLSQQTVEEFHLNRTVVLNGYFPYIQPFEMRAVIDGVPYPIRGVEHDGQRYNTRLHLTVVTPHG